MVLQRLVNFLVPREEHFFDFLEQQADVAHQGAQALASFKTSDPKTVRQAVQDLEHKGDGLVHSMEDALAKTFVTPIDREDLQQVSSQLDDILDFTNAAARAAVLFGVTRPSEAMMKLMDILVRCTEELAKELPQLRKKGYSSLIETSRTLRKLEKDGDTIFRDAVSALFHDPTVDAKVLLREREILEDLENAIDRCERVAETLALLSVKHG
ncbi:MAG: DUF47 family protein [Myxococcota bacterium]